MRGSPDARGINIKALLAAETKRRSGIVVPGNQRNSRQPGFRALSEPTTPQRPFIPLSPDRNREGATLAQQLWPETVHTTTHSKPPNEHAATGDYVHKLTFTVEDEDIGAADLVYRGNPFPYYYLSFIKVLDAARGFGFGSHFLGQVNGFLERKGKSGLLFNSINEKKPSRSLYEDHGWRPVDDHPSWYIYNTPESLAKGQVDRAIYDINQLFS